MTADERTDIAALREALAAVDIDGPWSAATTGVRGGDHWYICNSGESVAQIAANDGIDEEQREPRARLIVAAVNALPKLLDELDAARATIARVTALVREWMPIETCENFGQPYDCISCGKTLPCHNCRMREEFRAALAPAHDATEAS